MSEPITQLLQRLNAGDASVRGVLFERVYAELRRLARGHMSRRDKGMTLQPTALVHEAYLKLVQIEDASFDSRKQFYALASRVMRTLLVDHARARNAQKRGGAHAAIPIDSETPMPDVSERLIDWMDFGLALEDLEAIDGELARVAELRYLAGLEVSEVAATMDAAVRTTERRLRVANSWLRDRLDAH
jgi:RNA polymerase sigma factor (TIGR02999 family)